MKPAMVFYQEIAQKLNMVRCLKFSVKIEDIKNVDDYLKFDLRLR